MKYLSCLSLILFVIFIDRISRCSRGEFECEGVRITVSTSKSEATVLCWKQVDCSLRVGKELLP